MTKGSVGLLLCLVLIVGSGYGCKKIISGKEIMPEILFMEENYYSGKNGYGTFVDREGNIYAFDLREADWMDSTDKYNYLVKNYLEGTNPPESIGEVEADTLESYYSAIKKASASKSKLTYKESNLDVVYGYQVWLAFRYSKANKLQAITLYGSGDSEVVNKDKYVKKVVDSIKKMLPVAEAAD